MHIWKWFVGPSK